jgi:hypothetical protein
METLTDRKTEQRLRSTMAGLFIRAVRYPFKLARWIMERRRRMRKGEDLRKRIITYFTGTPGAMGEEEQEVVDYLRHHPLAAIPYRFADETGGNNAAVERDPSNGLPFVMHRGQRLYFKRNWTIPNVRFCYSALLAEQHERSPHRYVGAGFQVRTGDIVADVGAAEGIFALSVVEDAAEVHLFEGDPSWAEALAATFRPWRDKVRIVHAFVGNEPALGEVRLDDHFVDHPPTVMKLDVEGSEANVLNGARHILDTTAGLRIAVCTYHKQHDAAKLAEQLGQYPGFSLARSSGFMIFLPDPDQQPPYLRRGMLRAWRE